MQFKPGYIYHIYNRGNNKTRIFFNDENYLFFLRKARKELSAYFYFLAYCLMPNHFHFLIMVKEMFDSSDDLKSSDEWVNEESSDEYSKQISNQIAILLRSYTRAINIQAKRSGSLFQQRTKAKCLNELNVSQNNYASACFHYIHQNPINAKFVKKLEQWEYSSFSDYAGLRNGTLCNKDLAFHLLNYDKDNFIEHSYAVIDEAGLNGIWL